MIEEKGLVREYENVEENMFVEELKEGGVCVCACRENLLGKSGGMGEGEVRPRTGHEGPEGE